MPANMPLDMIAQTRSLLNELSQRTPNPVTNAQIFRATTLKRNWITRFMKNKIPNPSVNRVQSLYNYLLSVK